jgi:hypothetical protein
MTHTKLVFVGLILICLNLHLYSQKDTTICFEINQQADQDKLDNVLGLDICYANYYNAAPMLGMYYERIMSKNQTISFNIGSNKYTQNRYYEKINYLKIEYRFYFPYTKIPKVSSINKEFYLQKKKMALSKPEGLFLGIAAVFKNGVEESSNNFAARNKYTERYSIGGSIGYQFQLFRRVHTNISLPLVIGYRYERTDRLFDTIEEMGLDLSALININLGFSF